MTKELRSILLAEDSNEDVEMVLAALADFGSVSAVTVVGNGEEALDFLYRRGRYAERTAGNPSVVLLDLKMPKIDGLQVLKTIRSDPQLRLIPVVMLTSSQEDRDIAQSYALGVNAYIVKPVGFSQFLRTVSQLASFWTIHNRPPPGTIGITA